MSHAFQKIGATVVVAILAPMSLRAESLVTHYFEGEVNYSTSPLVNVGDRLTGTFTYDLDWEDQLPNNPDKFVYSFPPEWPMEPFPFGSAIGMSYTVGSLSHHSGELVELIISNALDEDYLYFSSDVAVGPSGPVNAGGYVELLDATGAGLSSDQPPAMLDLSAFQQLTFWGTDGQQDFLATIDTLRVVPEPATANLLLLATAGLLAVLRARGWR